jgi:preprotein translocase subunit SecG
MLTVQVVACLFMILIVLMQPSKADGGLGAAFGSGATDTLFGARTGNILTKATVWLAVILFVNSILLGFLFSRQSSAVLDAVKKAPPAAAQKAEPAAKDKKAAAPATESKAAAPAKPAAPAKAPAPAPAAK